MISIKKPKAIGFKYVEPKTFVSIYLKKLNSVSDVHAVFLLFLAMTGLRIGSALETRYTYIKPKDMKIIYPADKMKMRREFELPITDR